MTPKLSFRTFVEAVNDEVFWRWFEKKKTITLDSGTYDLVAKAGSIDLHPAVKNKSEQFRIEVKTSNGVHIGTVNFKRVDDSLEAIDVTIDKNFRRLGLATELYKFARELGNDIKKSDMLTPLGAAFWSKKSH